MYIGSRGQPCCLTSYNVWGSPQQQTVMWLKVSVVLGLRNPVLESKVGNKKIQASVMANYFTSAPVFLFWKMELKISTLAISQSCWGKIR